MLFLIRADDSVFPIARAYGAVTSTFQDNLSDGAQIFLVTGVMLDRKGNEYPDVVTPDQEILSEVSISTIDPVIRPASDWLSGLKAL